MRHFLSIIFLFAALLLLRCTDEKMIETVPPDPDKDFAELSIRLGKTTTKADDDIPATDQEKKIESLACFIQTFDEGIIGQEGYKPGAFLKLFSHEAKGSVNGFTDFDFDSNPPIVKMKIQSQGFKDLTKLVFIANYEQNGLKDALLNVNRMEDLADIYTPEVTAQGIKYPLLMTGLLEVPLSNKAIVTNQEVILTRIMARIDIQNNANTGDKPFVLQSAEIVNPKLYSYLIEGNDDSYNIPVLTSFTATQSAGSDKIEGLYTYETANDGSVEHTAVLVRGTLKGETYSKRIDMHTAGQPVPLGRNKRYQIVLNKTGDNQDISFTFKIDDWEDGVSFPVKPEHNKPVLDGLIFSNGFDRAYWNEVEALYNMENQPVGQISFSVTGRQQIAVKVSEAISYSEGSTSNLEGIVNIQVTDPVFNEDGTITQHVTLDFATAGILQNKEPVDLSIQVYNVVKPSYNETLHVTNLLPYPGTNFKPVWLNGLYWAPVNVGQTRLDAEKINGSPVRSNEQMGYYFQWCRNAAHWLLPGLTVDQKVEGPLSYQEANNSININRHINSTGTNQWDWLLPDDPNKALRDGLWNNGNDNDNPCPAGWKIPTASEASSISNRPDLIKEEVEKRYRLKGDDEQYLYFSYVSHLQFQTGGSQIEQTRILFWTSSLSETRPNYARSFDTVYSPNGELYDWNISYGFTLRCIRK